MNPPETPSPAEQKCPNCGTFAPLDMALCPRCGMQLSAPSKAIYGCATALFQGFLTLLALFFGASGACFTWFSLGNLANDFGAFFIGAVLLSLGWACIWAIIRIGKGRK